MMARGKQNTNWTETMHNATIPELDNKGLREFGLVTGGVITGLFGLFFPWLLEVGIPAWPFVLGGVLVAWGLLHPSSLRPVYTGWMKFGMLLSRITTPVVMGVVFFLVVLPVGLIMRLAGRDPMARKLEPDRDSYRTPSEKPATQSMERPF
jgi:hypothetical protein